MKYPFSSIKSESVEEGRLSNKGISSCDFCSKLSFLPNCFIPAALLVITVTKCSSTLEHFQDNPCFSLQVLVALYKNSTSFNTLYVMSHRAICALFRIAGPCDLFLPKIPSSVTLPADVFPRFLSPSSCFH